MFSICRLKLKCDKIMECFSLDVLETTVLTVLHDNFNTLKIHAHLTLVTGISKVMVSTTMCKYCLSDLFIILQVTLYIRISGCNEVSKIIFLLL